MDELITQAKKYWETLASRERMALMAMTVSLVIFLIYHLLWSNAVAFREESSKQFEAQLELYEWIKSNEQALRQTTGSANSITGNRSLVSYITQTARTFNLTISRYEPRKNNEIRLSFLNVRFDQLLNWLIEVNKEGVDILDVTLDKTNTPGMVRANLILSQ